MDIYFIIERLFENKLRKICNDALITIKKNFFLTFSRIYLVMVILYT